MKSILYIFEGRKHINPVLIHLIIYSLPVLLYFIASDTRNTDAHYAALMFL